jgi:hypothetical protein
MSLADRLFRRKGKVPELDLGDLQSHLVDAVPAYVGRTLDTDLLRARLADRCRDAGLNPLRPEEYDALASGLDGDALGRLGLLIGTLDLEVVRAALPALTAERPVCDLVAMAFTALARDTPLLTLELLRHSPLRVEEFARMFIARLGAAVSGETPRVSRERLERLDYAKLLAEAERARQAAAERMAHLQRLQDEQEQGRPRRGKW